MIILDYFCSTYKRISYLCHLLSLWVLFYSSVNVIEFLFLFFYLSVKMMEMKPRQNKNNFFHKSSNEIHFDFLWVFRLRETFYYSHSAIQAWFYNGPHSEIRKLRLKAMTQMFAHFLRYGAGWLQGLCDSSIWVHITTLTPLTAFRVMDQIHLILCQMQRSHLFSLCTFHGTLCMLCNNFQMNEWFNKKYTYFSYLAAAWLSLSNVFRKLPSIFL